MRALFFIFAQKTISLRHILIVAKYWFFYYALSFSIRGYLQNFSAKTVVVIAIGAALYGIGGLPMFGVPVPANTTLNQQWQF